MKLKIEHSILLLFILFFSCSSDEELNNLNQEIPSLEETACPDGCFYFNSFETQNDLSNFGGLYYLKEDTPSEGGDSSLYVAGGCITPHFDFRLGPFDEEKEFSFSIWGKMDVAPGYVRMVVEGNNSTAKGKLFDENEWVYFESEKLIVPEGKQIIFEFSSGGLGPGGACFDILKVIDSK